MWMMRRRVGEGATEEGAVVGDGEDDKKGGILFCFEGSIFRCNCDQLH